MTCSKEVSKNVSTECKQPIVKKPIIKRRFLGKLNGFDDNVDRNFNKKMLKAYLRGNTRFSFGLTRESRQPIMYDVQQEYYEVS